jgi:hypothetical protein
MVLPSSRSSVIVLVRKPFSTAARRRLVFVMCSLSTKPLGRGSKSEQRLISIASSSVASKGVDCVHLDVLGVLGFCFNGRRCSFGFLDRAAVNLSPLSLLSDIVGLE